MSRAAWPTVLSDSIHTISVRGVMTSRAVVSPSSKTDWIMRDSPSATTPRSRAMSTISSSSISEAKGPLRKPPPGVTALPRPTSRVATGPRTTPVTVSGVDAPRASV